MIVFEIIEIVVCLDFELTIGFTSYLVIDYHNQNNDKQTHHQK